ncbi:MAG: hypothetical protein HQK51_11615 [Oligoflexia bacterium]|nr:hypothetical protein [Oligoflexia bacterium]
MNNININKDINEDTNKVTSAEVLLQNDIEKYLSMLNSSVVLDAVNEVQMENALILLKSLREKIKLLITLNAKLKYYTDELNEVIEAQE